MQCLFQQRGAVWHKLKVITKSPPQVLKPLPPPPPPFPPFSSSAATVFQEAALPAHLAHSLLQAITYFVVRLHTYLQRHHELGFCCCESHTETQKKVVFAFGISCINCCLQAPGSPPLRVCCQTGILLCPSNSQDIPEGTEACISYIDLDLPLHSRRSDLQRFFNFVCSCQR